MANRPRVLGLLTALSCIALGVAGIGGQQIHLGMPAPNDSGVAQTVVAGGDVVSADEPFFQSLGTNGRACVTCHVPNQGWSLQPTDVQRQFESTAGQHPLFRVVDGATSPLADVSTAATRREAYALLLGRGVIRVGLPVPPGADFDLVDIDDPYGYASASELSLFRRPLPSTNLQFLKTVMWDGRESPGDRSLHADLMLQANDATVGHAQASPIDDFTRGRIADFELRLTTAQTVDRGAGRLTAEDAQGGPSALAAQAFASTTTSTAQEGVFTIFTPWITAVGRLSAARQAIGRGQQVFNGATHNDRLMCAGCHSARNVGTNSAAAFFNIRVGAVEGAGPRPTDLPVYTFQCHSGGLPISTTDPGRALITGRCADIGKFKVPILRGLATRAPYFHNGSAATVEDVIAHYKARFGFGFVGTEEADLLTFLKAL